MTVFFEILKYILPSLVVFAAVYFIQKQHLQKEYNLKMLELKSKYSKDAIPLKLQAYERLLLFCDRIRLSNLLLRLKSPNMSAVQLKTAMIIAVQKEFEHNMAQQLYTSHKLWDIIELAKNNIINQITDPSIKAESLVSAESFAQTLLQKNNSSSADTIKIAINAIKEEAKIILNV